MTLLSLSESIPTAEPGHSPEERMRATLGPLVARASAVKGSDVRPVKHDFLKCPNCGKTAPSERSPFCGDGCREMAAFVRQFRASLQNGLLAEPERQLALAQKLWSLQGGGYPYRQTLIPRKTLLRVIEQAGGKCTVCGAPATEAEHTGSG